jgi:hypothetical protein
VDHIDTGTACWYIRNIEEEDVVLREGHHGFIAALIWHLFDVHPLECRTIGSFHETHVHAEQFSMR